MESKQSAPLASNEGDPINAAAAEVPFKFYSFLPCTQQKQSFITSPKTNGYSTDKSGVMVIIDSDDEGSTTISAVSEPQYEFLCEVDFDKTVALPRPIELKVEFKKETQDCDERTQRKKSKQSNHTSHTESMDYSDCEDELLTLCKIEPVCDLNEGLSPISTGQDNHYIYFICPQCGERHDCHRNWRQHIDVVHKLANQQKWNFKRQSNNEFECCSCHAVLTRCTLKTLQQHHFTHLPYKVYHCKLCPYEENSMFLMISHIMLHKERDACNSTKTQDGNGTSTAREAALWEHESRTLIAYICPACGLTFDAEDTWQAHINFSHNFLEKTAENRFGDHFKCSECGVEIFSQHIADLQQHLFTHLPYKSYLKCKICSWTISRRNFILSHILNLHKMHLNVRASSNDDTVRTPATSTTVIPSTPATTTTIETANGRTSSTSGTLEETTKQLKDLNANSAGVPQPIQPSADNESILDRYSIAYTSSHTNFDQDSSNTTVKSSKCKTSYTCKNCSKHYLYVKCYDKHLRSCKPRNTTL